MAVHGSRQSSCVRMPGYACSYESKIGLTALTAHMRLDDIRSAHTPVFDLVVWLARVRDLNTQHNSS